MTVLCVNSTVVYADITAADAAEGGTDFGVPTRFEQTGLSSSAVGFVSGDYPSLFIYTATAGEETTGDISVGAQCTGNISVATQGTISNLRTANINLNFTTNGGTILLNVVSEVGGDMVYRSDMSYEFTNSIFYNASDCFRATSTNDNAIATNVTCLDASAFGFLRPRAVDCVGLNTGSAAYLQEGGSSSNYWADDGTGSDAITEGTPTDIFEDYAGGDYRIKASSSVGVAGAGAFINSASGITVTGTAIPTQTEEDIVTGGKTIILTLAGDTFVTGTSSLDGIAGGSDSDVAASGTNWDSLIKTALDNTDVVLSVGDTVATITLPAFGTYDIPGTETITWTIPAASLTTGTSDIIATPTHTITAVVSGVSIPVIMNSYRQRRA